MNEELGRIFPLFKEFSSGGNSLERVLALEIELAEALQAKKKPSSHFQRYITQYNHGQLFRLFEVELF